LVKDSPVAQAEEPVTLQLLLFVGSDWKALATSEEPAAAKHEEWP
jgi:hypothetical protein